MLDRLRRTLTLMTVLIGALAASIAVSAPARADSYDCLQYLYAVTGEVNDRFERACRTAFLGTAADIAKCASMLRAEDLVAMAVFEACRRGAWE